MGQSPKRTKTVKQNILGNHTKKKTQKIKNKLSRNLLKYGSKNAVNFSLLSDRKKRIPKKNTTNKKRKNRFFRKIICSLTVIKIKIKNLLYFLEQTQNKNKQDI